MPRSENGLVGSFKGMDVAEGMYLLSNNSIVLCGTGCNIGANRAYIDMNEVPVYTAGGRNEVKSIRILTDEEDPDGINEIHNSQFIIHNEDAVYDIGGRKMFNGQSSMFNGLKKGIYIVNGKKMVF